MHETEQKNIKWILVKSDTNLKNLKFKTNLIGFDYYAFELANDDLIDTLSELTQKKQFRLATLLRDQCSGVIKEYIKTISEVGAKNIDPFWQAHEVAAKTGEGQLPLVCVLAASVSQIPLDKGIILANLSKASIQVLSKSIVDAGYLVEVVSSSKFIFRDTKIFKFLKFIKISYKNISTWTNRKLQLRRAGLMNRMTLPSGITVVRSYFFKNSVKNTEFNDIYFAPLLREFKRQGTLYAHWCSFYDFEKSILSDIKKITDHAPIVFLENYLKILEIFKATYYSTKSAVHILWYLKNNPVYVKTTNITPLLIEDVLIEWSNGQSFVPILNYIASKNFAAANPSTKILYPFENLTWERMMLVGLKQGSSGIRTIAHQHSLLVPSQMYVHLATDEHLHLPLPDRIIATGPKAAEALQGVMHLPLNKIVSGCALRGLAPTVSTDIPKPENLNILVALNTIPDAVGLIRILRGVNFDTQELEGVSISVKFRFHPLFSEDIVTKYVKLPDDHPFLVDSGSLMDALDWANVVIYSGSTVGLEAMYSKKIPTIYVDLDSIINRDSLSYVNFIKYNVDTSLKLPRVLSEILNSWDIINLSTGRQGLEQCLGYFSKADDEGISRFISHM